MVAYLQFQAACLLFQIQSHLYRVHKAVTEQADIISVVEVFERPCYQKEKSIYDKVPFDFKFLGDLT